MNLEFESPTTPEVLKFLRASKAPPFSSSVKVPEPPKKAEEGEEGGGEGDGPKKGDKKKKGEKK